MPRVQIDLPDRFAYSTELPVYSSHINEGGHVDNALMLTLVSERARYFASLGYSEDNVEGLMTTMADAAVTYRSEAFWGDVLVFEVLLQDFNKYGFDLVYRITAKAGGREIARGKNGIVFLQNGLRKVAPIPPAFLQRLADSRASLA